MTLDATLENKNSYSRASFAPDGHRKISLTHVNNWFYSKPLTFDDDIGVFGRTY